MQAVLQCFVKDTVIVVVMLVRHRLLADTDRHSYMQAVLRCVMIVMLVTS